MERLSDAVRGLVPEEKDPAKNIDKRLAVLADYRVDVVDGVEVSPVSAIPVKVSVIFQVGARRMLELSQATIREINLGNLSSMCVVGRAAFETACLLYDVSRRVRDYVKSDKPEAINELDEYLVAILLGHKSKEWAISEEIQARNILGIIRHLDKEFSEIDPSWQAILMWFYDGLSEHAHPNYHGMLATYSLVKEEGQSRAVTYFTDGRPGRNEVTTIHALQSLEIALGLAESAIERYEEDLPSFCALAERFIFERGTWPADVPYPVQRTGSATNA